jgi:hypothetical protein
MLSIAHGVTGALIATKIGNPFLSTPLILITHYVQDLIPHWDFGTGMTKKLKSKKSAFFQELLIDIPVSIILVFFIFRQYESFSIYPWLGWFLGLLPDFLEFPYLFLNARFFPIKDLAKLHAICHRSTPKILLGLAPQFGFILLTYLLVN